MSIEQIAEDILLRKDYYNKRELNTFLTQTITNINSSFLDYHIHEDKDGAIILMVMTEFCFYHIIINKNEIEATTSALNSLYQIWRIGENPLGAIKIWLYFQNYNFGITPKIGDDSLDKFLKKVETQATALKYNYFNNTAN